MANRFLSNIRINDAYTFPASDGSAGQAIITDGAGNLSFGTVSGGGGASASVVYRENFTGDGTTTNFTLTRTITDENITQVYIDGVYQEKDAYSIVSLNTISFTAAPPSGDSIEVMYFYAIDAIPQPSTSVIYRDNFTGDGATTAFTLANSIEAEDHTQVYIDGAYQEKGTYTALGTSLTFDTAPASGHSVEVISIAALTRDYSPTTIYQDNFTGDGTTVAFTMQNAVDDEVKTMVYFDGVYQFKGTYAVDGVTITFDAAPASGVDVEVITIASARGFEYNAQTLYFYGKANEAISKGDAIMFAGQQGDHFLFAKATQAAIAANHEYFIGLATQDLLTGEFGYVTEFGSVTGLDTTAYTAGDILWFDAGGTTAGALTNVEPTPPLVKIQVAAVVREHQNEGVLFVRPTWYHELNELHDVNITSVADKDLLVWDNANGYWENSKTLGDITVNSLSGALADGVTATTQTLGDNSTKVATTAYVDAQVTASDLDFAGDTGTGAVDLDSQTFTIAGTANEIETSASGQTVTIGLPSSVTVGTLNATTLAGTLSTAAQTNITSVGTLTGLTVSADATINSLTVGKGGSNLSTNVALGDGALVSNTTGLYNTAIGSNTLISNTSASNNAAIGRNALRDNTIGAGNIAIGRDALLLNTTASNNVAVGVGSLTSNTTGTNNTAVGRSALQANTTASNNAAFGLNALYYNTTGERNTAIGNYALGFNTTASYNTALGYAALYANTTGEYNTATGYNSLSANTTGYNNTAYGAWSLYSNTTGIYNTAIGHGALDVNTTANYNVAVGGNALGANTTGTANTALGTSALFANTTASYNTAVGTDAMQQNTTGANNVAVGTSSLLLNTTGSQNTALGREALYSNTTASNNTAVGYRSLENNTTGTANSALGVSALRDNTTGSNNTAFGAAALTNNTTGIENTAVGKDTLAYNTSASYNTAIGSQALLVNTGASNVAVGRASLYSNTTGSSNTSVGMNSMLDTTSGAQNAALGTSALGNNTTASNNVAVGYNSAVNTTTGSGNVAIGMQALRDNTTGTYNTIIGESAGVSITGNANIVIGSRTSTGDYSPVINLTTQNDTIVMGSSAVTLARIKVAWTTGSDARDKTEFAEVPYGLNFVSQLNPVSYKFRKSRESEEAVGKTHYGFKAQDVLALEGENPVIVDNTDENSLGFKESNLIPVLVNAIKEQQNIINDLKARIETLESK